MSTYSVEIVKIVDGDTVDVNINLGFGITLRNQRVRLNGVDTPESRTSDKEEKEFGLLVKKKVIEFIQSKKNHKMVVYKENDKYGRILADIVCEDESLCSYLLNNKYAVEYDGKSKADIKNQHKENKTLIFNEL